jgi:hypothetical protein
LPFFASFSKIEKSAKNGRKGKAIALLFCHFLPLFQKLKNRLKMDEKLRLYLTCLSFFASFSKIDKSAKNGRKVKAIALLVCYFLPLFQKLKNRQKMDEKVRP